MDELHIIAEDTISRTPEIIAATQGASADSTFHAKQLPPLNKDDCPNFPPFTVKIKGLDAFTTARNCVRQGPTIRGKVTVLNLASDLYIVLMAVALRGICQANGSSSGVLPGWQLVADGK